MDRSGPTKPNNAVHWPHIPVDEPTVHSIAAAARPRRCDDPKVGRSVDGILPNPLCAHLKGIYRALFFCDVPIVVSTGTTADENPRTESSLRLCSVASREPLVRACQYHGKEFDPVLNKPLRPRIGFAPVYTEAPRHSAS
jgi:hypothetical protein